MTPFHLQVQKELTEMKRIGMRVPHSAIELCTEEFMAQYDTMRISDAADLIIDIADLNLRNKMYQGNMRDDPTAPIDIKYR